MADDKVKKGAGRHLPFFNKSSESILLLSSGSLEVRQRLTLNADEREELGVPTALTVAFTSNDGLKMVCVVGEVTCPQLFVFFIKLQEDAATIL